MQLMARVEIHNATRETYDRLHAAMEAESFSRTMIGATDGLKHKMPIGTYRTEAYRDAWSAADAAARAALPIDPAAEIVVSGDGQLVFRNCPVEPEYPYAVLGGLYDAAMRKNIYGTFDGANQIPPLAFKWAAPPTRTLH